jgi:hypothetical protein
VKRKTTLFTLLLAAALLLSLFLWRGGHWLVHEKELHPAEAIRITPGDISSTRGEAIAVRQYLQSHGLHPSSVRAKNFSPQRITIVSSPPL